MPPSLQVGVADGAGDEDELPRPSAVSAASPKTPRPILAPAAVVDDDSSLAEAVEKPMPAISLLLSAAKQNSFNAPLSNGKPTQRYSLDHLAGSAPAGADLVATDAKARLRQLLAIRIIERHYTRHVRVRPSQLYSDEARTKQAEWGKLVFATGAASKQRHNVAHYMRVSRTSEAGRVARCFAKYWQIAKPSVIIAITGGARGLRVSAWHRKAFCEGLLAAAKATAAIIFTGGTATGVMSLVGDAIGGHGIPCVGFASWGKTLGSPLLAGNHGESEPRKYAAGGEATGEGAALEPRHSHFVLVDSGGESGGNWGDEIPLRDAVQHMLETWFKVPGVMLVIQGGPGTLRTIVEGIITSATPVIIVEDSGGAADAVAGYHHGWNAADRTSTFDLAGFENGVRSRVPRHSPTQPTIARTRLRAIVACTSRDRCSRGPRRRGSSLRRS